MISTSSCKGSVKAFTRAGVMICVGDSPILGLSHCLPLDTSWPNTEEEEQQD